MMDHRRLNPSVAAAVGALVLLLALMAASAAVYDDEDEWESYGEETEIESAAGGAEGKEEPEFVERKGSQLVVGGQPFYVNGFNTYWLMQMAVDAGTREKVTQVMADAAEHGLSVCRTWAFADGGWHALQKSPGVFDEDVFRALDFVVAQARAHGLRLILSLSNNWDAYGGKAQYLRWGAQAGAPDLSPNASADAFFSHPTLRGFFKAAVTAVVTRVNSVTGVAYRDDPAIMAWELMNEARCPSDPSGHTLRAWLTEMALHVKSLDNRHLVTTGLEGFYSADSSSPSSPSVNPNPYAALQGSDFVRHHAVAGIDVASAHVYSDAWLAAGAIAPWHIEWASKWVRAHIEDADKALGGMPLILGEFGVSARDAGFNVSLRDQYFSAIYDALLDSIRQGGAGAGALLWQLVPAGMDYMDDGYAIVLSTNSSSSSFVTTSALVKRQSFRVNTFNSLCSTTCRWRCKKPRPRPSPSPSPSSGPQQAQAAPTLTSMTCPSSSSSYCPAPLYD